MKLLTVIAEDRPGLLADVTAQLEQAGIDILDLDGEAVGGTAVLTLRADPYREAFHSLSRAGFRVVGHDHLLVRLDKHPGALAELSRQLADAHIDIRGMHIISRDAATGIVALETGEPARARALLADRLVREGPAEGDSGAPPG